MIKKILVVLIAVLILNLHVYADLASCTGPVEGEQCKEYKLITKSSGKELCEEVFIPNCCPNNTCESESSPAEDYGTCPADCDPTEVTITTITPAEGETFYRGEKVILKIGLTSSNVPVIGGSVNAKSNLFGELKLYNDGKHDDGSGLDNVYANNFEVSQEVMEGVYDISIAAEFRDVNNVVSVDFVVKPYLTTDVELKEMYAFGDNIEVEGTLKKKNLPVATEITMKIMAAGKLIKEETFKSDDSGRFSTAYHTSQISPKGEWTLTLTANDGAGNELNFEKNFEVVEPETYTSLNLEVLSEFEESYARGTKFDLKVKVTDESNKAVTGANVKLTTPQNDILEIPEVSNGEYSGEIPIAYDVPSGKQKYEVSATKTDGSLTFEGKTTFEIKVEEIKMNVEITHPDKVHYEIGEYVPVEVKLTYPDGEKIGDANVVAKVNSKEIQMQAEEVGIYYVTYIPDEKDEGRITLDIEAVDKYGNKGGASTKLDISGFSLNYIIQKNMLWIITGFVVLIIGGGAGYFLLKKRNRVKNLVKRRKELMALNEELQVKYYDESTLSKQEYKELTDKYTAELDDIERQLEEIKQQK